MDGARKREGIWWCKVHSATNTSPCTCPFSHHPNPVEVYSSWNSKIEVKFLLYFSFHFNFTAISVLKFSYKNPKTENDIPVFSLCLFVKVLFLIAKLFYFQVSRKVSFSEMRNIQPKPPFKKQSLSVFSGYFNLKNFTVEALWHE